MLNMIFDIHTHNLDADNAVISVTPENYSPQPGKLYSVGVHPWDTEKEKESILEQLEDMVIYDPRVVAIGESGIDILRGASKTKQIEFLKFHIYLSEKKQCPLVLHCVRANGEIIALHKRFSPKQPWIVHGFRGKSMVASAFVAAGIYISFGYLFNPAAVCATPLDKILVETDDSEHSLVSTYNKIAKAKGIKPHVLRNAVMQNIKELFHSQSI